LKCKKKVWLQGVASQSSSEEKPSVLTKPAGLTMIHESTLPPTSAALHTAFFKEPSKFRKIFKQARLQYFKHGSIDIWTHIIQAEVYLAYACRAWCICRSESRRNHVGPLRASSERFSLVKRLQAVRNGTQATVEEQLKNKATARKQQLKNLNRAPMRRAPMHPEP
jgi:hypothetical protein